MPLPDGAQYQALPAARNRDKGAVAVLENGSIIATVAASPGIVLAPSPSM